MVQVHKSKEYRAYQYLQHWKRVSVILPPQKLFDPKDKHYHLFSYIYTKTKEFYDTLPLRKNGEKPFIHPINVVYGYDWQMLRIQLSFAVAFYMIILKKKLISIKKNMDLV